MKFKQFNFQCIMSEKSVRFSEEMPPIEDGDWEDIIEDQAKEQERELTIQEEYKLWRKNCHYMYDFISETALTWPSLSIQWLPNHVKQENSIAAKLLLSTHTSGEDINYIKIAKTQLPLNIVDKSIVSKEQINSKIKISKKLRQDSEINRVRYSPADPDTIASINGQGEVFVYNLSDTSKEPLQLKHHQANGFGLSWNYHERNSLLTGSDDKTVLLWDIGNPDTPKSIITAHQDIVNDVKWSPHSPFLFGSVSDDKSFKFFDTRESLTIPVLGKSNVSASEINCLSFSCFSTNLFVTGGTDNNVTLFDLRLVDRSLHQMIGHTDSITTLEWSPLNENIILSGSSDRRCILWDLNSIGKELLADDAEDGVAELMFMHGGHTGAINDLSFDPEIPFCLASLSDDNIVHIWKVSDKISGGDEVGYDDIDLTKLE